MLRYFSVLFLATVLMAEMAHSTCLQPDTLQFVVNSSTRVGRGDSLAGLSEHLQVATGVSVEVVDLDRASHLMVRLDTDRFHLAIMDPKIYIQRVNQGSELEPFATFYWRDEQGRPEAGYRSLLVTQAGRYGSLNDLKGASLALVGPGSSAGYVMPLVYFSGPSGEHLSEFFGSILESGRHASSLDAVLDGTIAAAFVASPVLDSLLAMDVIPAGSIDVLWRSEPMPGPPFVLNHALCPALKNRIREAVFSYMQTPAGKGWLSSSGVDGLITISDQHYDVQRRLLKEAVNVSSPPVQQ